ncbi:unnamed protein product [Prorocentrum cordatum]|uniref:Uncharacterized protein n=1 Tax=Prorocentrum cordatum TaxID=2364126 RepID=A0ABN9PWH8_9DINO|nr:unnamed protein product [Polarella glacialis]
MWIASLEPDVIVYNAAISACEKGEQWQRALGLLSEMREADLQPNVISATTLRSARARRASSGSGLWCFSARCGERICSPTLPIYSAGVSACEKGEQWQRAQWQRALVLLSEMGEVELEPTIIYNVGISACEKGLQWQRAWALLSEMWKTKLVPDVISYSAGISACERSEKCEY